MAPISLVPAEDNGRICVSENIVVSENVEFSASGNDWASASRHAGVLLAEMGAFLLMKGMLFLLEEEIVLLLVDIFCWCKCGCFCW